MSDPFSLVHDALWDLAEESVVLTSLVKTKNRIKYNSSTDRDPDKRNAMEADYPELTLLFTDLSGNLRDSSSSSMCKRQYQFGITVGDYRANQLLFPVEFALFAAMSGWCEVLSLLEWPVNSGWRFVKNFQLISANAGIQVTERNRGIKGWTALWTCEVSMHFKTSDLQAYGVSVGTGS